MKILVLNGSPKKKSDTFRLTDAFLKGLNRKGEHEVHIIHVAEKNIAPCRGCFGCWQQMNGHCVIEDDQNEILDLYRSADAVFAVIGNILMPIITILLLAIFIRYFRDNAVIESIFKGIRPCVVALIAAPVFTMAKNAGLTWKNCWIPLLAAALIWLLDISPVWIIIIAGLGGFLYGRFFDKKEASA